MTTGRKMALFCTVGVMLFVGALIVLSLSGGTDEYMPRSTSGAVIFEEACARCHGENGVGDGPEGPRLSGAATDPELVKERVQAGEARMPRFPNIRDMALENLAEYVHDL
jgi:mono/diheme cytochrome c family protein